MALDVAPDFIGSVGKGSSVADMIDRARAIEAGGFDPSFDTETFEASDFDASEGFGLMDAFASPFVDNGINKMDAPGQDVNHQAKGPDVNTVKAPQTHQAVTQPTSNQKHMVGQNTAQATAEIGKAQVERDIAAIDKALGNPENGPNADAASSGGLTGSGVAMNAAASIPMTALVTAVAGPVAGAAFQVASMAKTGVDMARLGAQMTSVEATPSKGGALSSKNLAERDSQRQSALHKAEQDMFSKGSVASVMAPGQGDGSSADKPQQGVAELEKTRTELERTKFAFDGAVNNHDVYAHKNYESGATELDAGELHRAAHDASLVNGHEQDEVLAMAELKPDDMKSQALPTLGG